MSEIVINSERFYQRLQRLVDYWSSNKGTLWGGSDVLCIPHGGRSDDTTNYSKSAAIQLYLLGYEIPDSIIVITKNGFSFMATDKKCKLLADSLEGKSTTFTFKSLVRSKDEGQNREHFNALIGLARKGGGSTIGSIFKAEYKGDFIANWMTAVDMSQLTKFEIASPLGIFLCTKDEEELVSITSILCLY